MAYSVHTYDADATQLIATVELNRVVPKKIRVLPVAVRL